MTLKGIPRIYAADLFCGVGGLTYGLGLGGIAVRAGFDLDPACRYPFEANNSAQFYERDVNDLTAGEVSSHLRGADLSLLVGCAPCQPFSTYSRGGRSKSCGEDWQLVSSFGRLVKDIQPDMVSMENVPQLADHHVFDKFLKCLAGYYVSWEVVECANVGIPQSRRRLVLLASRLGKIEVGSPREKMKCRTVRDVISCLPAIEAGQADPSDPLHVASSLSPLNLRRIQASKPGGTWRDWEPSLQAECHRRSSGATYPSVYGRMEWDKIAPTITTQCFGYGNGRFGHPEQDRAISLREAAMIQTFPRDYKFVPPGAPVKFSRLGRLIGNAVPVRLGEHIAKSLIDHVFEAGAHYIKRSEVE